MATSQKFDALDGLDIKGDLVVGSNVVIDSGTFVVDAVNNRVGVNKTPTTDLDINGTISATSASVTTLNVATSIDHTADTGTSLQFNNDEILFLGNGTERFRANTTAVYANSAISISGASIVQSTFQANSNKNGTGKIAASWIATSFIEASSETDASSTGIAIGVHTTTSSYGGCAADEIKLITNGATRLSANSAGINITGNISGITDLYVDNSIISTGDINTYLQFSGPDTYRIVTGGAQRLLANNTGVYVTGILDVSTDVTARKVQAEQYFVETTNNLGTVAAAGIETLDLSTGSSFYTVASGNFTANATNVPATGTSSWTFRINNNGTARVITWQVAGVGSSILWSAGEVPPPSAGIDIYTFIVIDGVVYGSLSIRDAKV